MRKIASGLVACLLASTVLVYAEEPPTPEEPITAVASETSRQVTPEQIAIEIEARQLDKLNAADDIKRKVLREFVPIRLNLNNKSGKLVSIPQNSILFLDGEGKQINVPTNDEIYKEVKRNGIGRALAWGVPLGVVSFGFLLVPALTYSGVHTKVMNTGVKDSLASNGFNGITLSPDGSATKFLLVPKSKADKIKKIMLTRVVNVEDDIQTQYVADIQPLEISNEKH